MKNSFSQAVLFSLFFVSSAYAEGGSGREGHGGETVTCFTSADLAKQVRHQLEENLKNKIQVNPLTSEVLDEITSVELLDLYSARRPKGWQKSSAMITSSESYSYLVDRQMEKARSTNFLFYQTLKRESEALPFEDWRSSDGVGQLDDAAIAFTLPQECVPIQIAYQQIITPKMAVISYNSRLFEKMDPVDQSALIFHEWLYHYFLIESQVQNSLKPQLIIGRFYSIDYSRLKSRDFNQFLIEVGFYGEQKTYCHVTGEPQQCFYHGAIQKETGLPESHYLNDCYYHGYLFPAGAVVGRKDYLKGTRFEY